MHPLGTTIPESTQKEEESTWRPSRRRIICKFPASSTIASAHGSGRLSTWNNSGRRTCGPRKECCFTSGPIRRASGKAVGTCSLSGACGCFRPPWACREPATWWNSAGAAACRWPDGRACGRPIPWNTSGAVPRPTPATPCSFAPRPCAWRKCFAVTFPKGRSFMGSPAAGSRWFSPRSCGRRCANVPPKCGTFTAGAGRPCPSGPSAATPVP